MATPKGSLGAGRPAEPAKAAGIAPRHEPGGERRRAHAPAATWNGFLRRASALKRDPGRRQGLRAAPRSEKGFERFTPREVLGTREGFGPALFRKGRPERFRPRCEPWRRHGSPCRIRQGKREQGLRSCPSDPTGIGERSSGLCRYPPGAERGFAASLRDPSRATRASVRGAIQSRPARDGLATQRRQSKLGQVGAGGDTGPHYDSGRPAFACSGASRMLPRRL